MTQLEKLLKRREEDRLKKLERERIKAEKKAEKERLKKITHKKKLKSKQNKRAYKKRRAVILEERMAKNDKHAFYSIIVTKNMHRERKIKRIGAAWWKTDALEIYNKAVEKNKAEVLCPVEVLETTNGVTKDGKTTFDAKYEILVVEKVDSEENKVHKFRNEDGKLVDNVIVDSDHKIIAKSNWRVEEKFSVYGFHPKKCRKDAHFILDEMILKDACRENVKRIFLFHNKIVIQYNMDFDFIIAKTQDEADRLYGILEKEVKKRKLNKFILFTDKLTPRMSTWILNELVKKTGWTRDACKCTV